MRSYIPRAYLLFLLPLLAAGPTGATRSVLAVQTSEPYTIRDLGRLPGFETTVVRGINSKTQVVGFCQGGKDPDTGYPLVRGFVWEDGKMVPLPTLGGPNSYAYGVNGRGEVAGDADTSDHRYPVVWRQKRVPGSLTGTPGSAVVLNDEGLAAGAARGGYLVLLGPDSSWQSIPFGDNVRVTVTGMNAKAHVVGWAEIRLDGGGKETHAFLVREGQIERLRSLGGRGEKAYGLSSDGRVVGSAECSDGVWQACLWYRGQVYDLETPEGWSSNATAINASGVVVGTITDPKRGLARACIWREGKLADLNTLIPPASGWELETAVGINDSGTIVGSGKRNGQAEAFYMKPPAPPLPRSFCGFAVGSGSRSTTATSGTSANAGACLGIGNSVVRGASVVAGYSAGPVAAR